MNLKGDTYKLEDLSNILLAVSKLQNVKEVAIDLSYLFYNFKEINVSRLWELVGVRVHATVEIA